MKPVVMVVEDEALIALLLEDMIVELGAIFVGPFASLSEALEGANQDNFDVALVDLNLGTERSDEVARVLATRRRPFALVSGNAGLDISLGQTTVLQKPFAMNDIAGALTRMSQARGQDGN